MTSQEQQLKGFLRDLTMFALIASNQGVDVEAIEEIIRREAKKMAGKTISPMNRKVLKNIAKCKDPVSLIELLDYRGVANAE